MLMHQSMKKNLYTLRLGIKICLAPDTADSSVGCGALKTSGRNFDSSHWTLSALILQFW